MYLINTQTKNTNIYAHYTNGYPSRVSNLSPVGCIVSIAKYSTDRRRGGNIDMKCLLYIKPLTSLFQF